MTPEVVSRYSAPVPRYTSYPTAPNFSRKIQAGDYRAWLSALPEGSSVSLYTHIPFCHTLCWYCGCNTKAVARYEPVHAYLDLVLREIETVSGLIPRAHTVTSIHWGGGSPNILSPADIGRLAEATRRRFHVAENCEFAVEIDPRNLGQVQVEAFRLAGVGRVSIGVQDFCGTVQSAINREQSFEETRRAIDLFRAAGVGSVNIDLVYGLPNQTRRSVAETVVKVLELRPDRIAIFGYAHLPSRFTHQRLIDEATLPGPVERFGQSRRLARVLVAAGYREIGLDHFALATDDLAQRPLKRNFQGYVVDAADALVGLGLSAIGRLPQGYVQNSSVMSDYRQRLETDGLATARGVALTSEDRVRAEVIERLMCDFEFSRTSLAGRYGSAAAPVIEEAEALVESDRDGLVARTADGFSVTERGRPFVRAICSCFDAYLDASAARHAPAI